MTGWMLIARGLRFHWRTHLAVWLGAAVAGAILVGALAVGDSVRHSLRRTALARLGEVRLALNGGDRFFRAALADDLAQGSPSHPPVPPLPGTIAPLLLLPGTASTNDARATVQVVGVDERFFRLAPLPASGSPHGRRFAGSWDPGSGSRERSDLAVSDALARRLGVTVGDELLLRVHKPSVLSRDAPLISTEDASVALRLQVAAVLGEEQFGRFSMEPDLLPRLSVFLSRERLAREIGLPGRVNVLLVGAWGARSEPTAEVADAALARAFQLEDAGLKLRALPAQGAFELRTARVFFDAPVSEAARKVDPGAQGVLTYFVNALRSGSRATPYSSVAALEPAALAAVMGKAAATALRDDEIVLNAWTAEDLGARPGEEVRLEYYVIGQGRALEERAATFRVRAIVPITGAAADRDLMPDIPGVTDRAHCREWDSGIPIDLSRIRPKDEAYWERYAGTPKAFITLPAGQRLWSNRFGDLTAVRYSSPEREAKPTLEAALRERIRPASVGLRFVPVREEALLAAAPALDFGALFLGFSFFLIAAALLLTGLLFLFGVESRRGEIGLLLALGWTPSQVRGLLLLEGAAPALLAGLAGAGVGLLYTRAVLHGLATVWRGAVAGAPLQFGAEPATLAVGAVAGAVVALLTIFLVARKQARVPARELLATDEPEARSGASAFGLRTPGLRTAILGAIGAAGLATAGLLLRRDAALLFFGAGALLLLAGIGACRVWLARQERMRGSRPSCALTLGSLGARNSSRRPGRSLAIVSLLACGSFMVIAVGASRHDPVAHAHERSSGTGGFAYYGETALPVYHDLNSEAGREAYGLDAEDLQGARVVPLRLYPGAEASCLNLNRPQTPRLLGVSPNLLNGRFRFSSRLPAPGSGRTGDGWGCLERNEPDGAVPAVGDVNTVVWSLGKSLGDTLSYRDERGNGFRVRIVGTLTNGILQGSLLISERRFVERFPSRAGYQVFLVDLPHETDRENEGRPSVVGGGGPSALLTRALEDQGLELTPAVERLAAFSTVENTYLSIFAALGSLGLLLGSVGLGVVVLRNMLERRSELGLLRAVGFRRSGLVWLAFSEVALLLVMGLVVGVAAGLLAAAPSLATPGAPTLLLAATLALVGAFGFLWTWGATALAARGPLIPALRNE